MDKSRENTLQEDYRDIVARIKSGNIFAATEWVEGRKDRLYRIVHEYASGPDIEEIIENAVVKIFQNIKELQNVNLFEPWAISIIIDECRKVSASKRGEAVSNEDEISVDNGGGSAAALKAMDGAYKDALVLKYYGGYSIDDIAKIMAITSDKVRHDIYLGLKKL